MKHVLKQCVSCVVVAVDGCLVGGEVGELKGDAEDSVEQEEDSSERKKRKELIKGLYQIEERANNIIDFSQLFNLKQSIEKINKAELIDLENILPPSQKVIIYFNM